MIERTNIRMQSVQSLFIEMYFDLQKLSCGTAFVAISASGPVLITNRHNVTGINQNTGKALSETAGIPNKVRVYHNVAGALGSWIHIDYRLLDDDGKPAWIEHPTLGAKADFVALPFVACAEIEIFPYDLSPPKEEILVQPAEVVSIIGFPFGESASGRFAIWVSGFVASDIDLNYMGLPQFLVDCRSRPGQSGSPVIAMRYNTVQYKNGDLHTFLGNEFEFLGIYSGRINVNSDISIIWKRSSIFELTSSIGKSNPPYTRDYFQKLF